MTANDVLADAFARIAEMVHEVLDGLSAEDLAARLDPGANSIGWLVWHLTRVQDDHLAALAGAEQVWLAGGWAQRFGLPFEPAATGYGQRESDVARVRVEEAALLAGYHEAVHAATATFLAGLTPPDYARVVDDRWDPPVTLGVRLVSVVSDDLAHAGQAAFVRGCLRRGR